MNEVPVRKLIIESTIPTPGHLPDLIKEAFESMKDGDSFALESEEYNWFLQYETLGLMEKYMFQSKQYPDGSARVWKTKTYSDEEIEVRKKVEEQFNTSLHEARMKDQEQYKPKKRFWNQIFSR